MWEAFFAFHIRTACFLPELLRRSVVERAMRAFAVVLPPPLSRRLPHVIQRAELARGEALVAQPSVEALDMFVLHRLARLDVDQADLRVLGPARHAPRGELRSVVRAHVLGPTALGDRSFQRPRHATGAKAEVGFERQALARVSIQHSEMRTIRPVAKPSGDEV